MTTPTKPLQSICGFYGELTPTQRRTEPVDELMFQTLVAAAKRRDPHRFATERNFRTVFLLAIGAADGDEILARFCDPRIAVAEDDEDDDTVVLDLIDAALAHARMPQNRPRVEKLRQMKRDGSEAVALKAASAAYAQRAAQGERARHLAREGRRRQREAAAS